MQIFTLKNINYVLFYDLILSIHIVQVSEIPYLFGKLTLRTQIWGIIKPEIAYNSTVCSILSYQLWCDLREKQSQIWNHWSVDKRKQNLDSWEKSVHFREEVAHFQIGFRAEILSPYLVEFFLPGTYRFKKWYGDRSMVSPGPSVWVDGVEEVQAQGNLGSISESTSNCCFKANTQETRVDVSETGLFRY